MFNNLVANLISNIRITIKHKRNKCRTHYSKFCVSIIRKLEEKKIVKNITFETINNRKYIVFDMPNYNYVYLIDNIVCCYKVSAYMYMNCSALRRLLTKYQDGIVSTSSGIFYVHECLKKNIGGKVILLYL